MRFFIERPIATLMIYLALLALGFYSLLHIPLELAPQEEFPQVDIAASWPGASPEVMQTQVTTVLEEAVLTVRGIRKISSTSNHWLQPADCRIRHQSQPGIRQPGSPGGHRTHPA